jgi:hypothetical protein
MHKTALLPIGGGGGGSLRGAAGCGGVYTTRKAEGQSERVLPRAPALRPPQQRGLL